MANTGYRRVHTSDGQVLFLATIDLPQITMTETTIAAAQVTNAATELTVATLSVAAQPIPYTIRCKGDVTAFNSVAADNFEFRVKVDGTTKAQSSNRHSGGVNERRTFAVVDTPAVSIVANTACSVTATLVRVNGTGTLTTENVGILSAWLVFP